MPRYWLSGEEKKLLYKLRNKGIRDSSGDYYRHLIPRNDEELNLKLELIPIGAIEEERPLDATLLWEEFKEEIESSGEELTFDEFKEKLKDLIEDGRLAPWGELYTDEELPPIIKQQKGLKGFWFWIEIHPYTVKPVSNPVQASRFENKEWQPQVFDNGGWRSASDWEGEHWSDLISCQSCGHPTMPAFQCNVCGNNIQTPFVETEKRVLSLECILPDFPVNELIQSLGTKDSEESKKEKPTIVESTELEEVKEDQVTEEQKEREEDEEEK